MRKTGASALSAGQIASAILLYAAATVFFFIPSFPTFTSQIIGPPQDNFFVYWSLWYGTESLWHHVFPFMRTTTIFYPEGISLYFSNYYYYGVAIAAFLRPFFSIAAIYNLLTLHTFIIAGTGAFLLAHYLCRDFRASLVAGFIFAFSPAHFSRSLQHLTLASLQFVPFFILYLVKSFREDKKSNVILAALFMSLDALCDWNYLVFDLLFIIFTAAFYFFKKRGHCVPSLRRIFWIPVIVFIVLSPLVVPMLIIGATHPFVEPLTGHDVYVADFFGFFVPHPQHLLSSVPWIAAINKPMTGDDFEKSVYLGIPCLALVFLTAPFIWKECRKYFLGLVGYMALAMGSHPHFLGQMAGFPFPYRVIEALPFFTQARCPVRIAVYIYIFLGILAAFSLKKIMGMPRVKKISGIVFLASFFLIFTDYCPKAFAMAPIMLPPCYEVIRRDPAKDFGIYELPWDYARYMMHQTIHGIPCVQGYMGRRVDYTLLDRVSRIRMKGFGSLRLQRKMLLDAHVKYIVIHKRRMTWEADRVYDQMYWQQWSKIAKIYSRVYDKVYEDDWSEVYKVY